MADTISSTANDLQNETSYMKNEAYEQGYRPFSTSLLRQCVKTCELFVDVGANCGNYCLLAAKANTQINVIAIAPIDEPLHVLRENMIRNSIESERVTYIKAPVSSRTGTAHFHTPEASNNSRVLPHPHSGMLAEVDPKAISLDDILRNEHDARLFIKISTDGNELEVLNGLAATCSRNNDITMLVEINPRMLKLAETGCEEVINFLFDHDFCPDNKT